MDESMAESQLKASRIESKSRLKSLRSILSTIIRTMPREEVIKVLKQKKIVRYEYSKEKDDLVLIERVNSKNINKANLGGEE